MPSLLCVQPRGVCDAVLVQRPAVLQESPFHALARRQEGGAVRAGRATGTDGRGAGNHRGTQSQRWSNHTHTHTHTHTGTHTHTHTHTHTDTHTCCSPRAFWFIERLGGRLLQEGGARWSGCNARIRLWPRLPPATVVHPWQLRGMFLCLKVGNVLVGMAKVVVKFGRGLGGPVAVAQHRRLRLGAQQEKWPSRVIPCER